MARWFANCSDKKGIYYTSSFFVLLSGFHLFLGWILSGFQWIIYFILHLLLIIRYSEGSVLDRIQDSDIHLKHSWRNRILIVYLIN